MSFPHAADVVAIALLILCAFLAGAVVGALLRLLIFRLARRNPALAVAEVSTPAIASPAEPLVAAPIIDPVRALPVPSAPEQLPVPDFAGVFASSPTIEAPARLEPMQWIEAVAQRPGTESAVVKRDDPLAPAGVPQRPLDATVEGPPAEAAPTPALLGDDHAVIPFPLPTEPEVPQSSAGPAIDWSAPPDIGTESVPATRPAPPSDAAGHDDEETAARRAIEGNWTPKGSAAARPAEMPELSAEDAMLASRNAIRAAGAAAMALLHHAPESVEPGSRLPSEDDEDEEPVRKAAQ